MTINTPGIYEITVHVSARQAVQMAVMLNDQPTAGGLFVINTTGSMVSGSTLLDVKAGDVLTIRNMSDSDTISIPTTSCSCCNPGFGSGITLIVKRIF